jgi:hypothetical protein
MVACSSALTPSFVTIIMTTGPNSRNLPETAKRLIQLHIEQRNRSRHREGDPDSEKLGILLNAMINFAPTPEGRDRVSQSVMDAESWSDLVRLYKDYMAYIIYPSEYNRYEPGLVHTET